MKLKKTTRAAAAMALFGAGTAQAGPLQISEDQRYFIDPQGEPYLYLADTAWSLLHKLDREQTDYYLKNRATKGFTVIQAVILSELNGLRKPNAYGELPLIDLDPTQPNEAYFKHIDYVVKKAGELGLQMALLPTWGDKVESSRAGSGPVIFNPENAAIYGEYLGARYKGQNVLWIVGGDRAVETDQARAVWIRMAEGLKKGSDHQHLVSFHPEGAKSSADVFHQEEWLDFNLYQSGHDHHFMPVYNFAERHLNLEPRKPVVDGEPAYEDIPIRFWDYLDWATYPGGISSDFLNEDRLLIDPGQFPQGFFTDYDVRIHGYWNLLSGAVGYAYGHNAVWQIRKKGEVGPIPVMQDWKDALDQPGAEDMRHLKDVFVSRPFHKLAPAQSIVAGPNPQNENHIRAAIANDGSFAMIYLAKGQKVTLESVELASDKAVAWWFDPRTGKSIKIGTHSTDTLPEFHPPSSGIDHDWLLVLDAEGVFTRAPGATE